MERHDATPWAYEEYQLLLAFEKALDSHAIANSPNPEVLIAMQQNRTPLSYEEFANYFAQCTEASRLSDTLKWTKGYEVWLQEQNEKNKELQQRCDEFGFPDYIQKIVQNRVNDLLNRKEG